ncbi:MAG: polyprenyl synthetase family protein [Candidatus Methanospirareceae archaeon]
MRMEEAMLMEDVKYFNRRMAEVMKQRLRYKPEILYGVEDYIMGEGGKKLRPIICLLAAEAVGGDREDALFAAISIELVHNASLIHDDILDGNYMRRGVPSKFAIYGERRAIILGDFLFGLSCEMLARCNVPRVVGLISKAVADISMGQYMEFIMRSEERVTEEYYMEAIALKTASLFGASAEAGAILGGGGEEEVRRLRDYGRNLGIVFQVQDDILDIFGDPAKTGKSVGLDIKNREKTILIIHALNNASPSEERYLRDILSGRTKVSDEDIRKVREIFLELGSIEYAARLSDDILRATKECIRGLKETEAKKKLMLIADLTKERVRREIESDFIDKIQ